MRAPSGVLVAVLLLTGCTADRAPRPSPAPIVSRPLPDTAAELGTELDVVAGALEQPGDGARERHDRLQACIRLARLHDHAKAERLLPAAEVGALAKASAGCGRDQAAAAAAVRSVSAPAS